LPNDTASSKFLSVTRHSVGRWKPYITHCYLAAKHHWW